MKVLIFLTTFLATTAFAQMTTVTVPVPESATIIEVSADMTVNECAGGADLEITEGFGATAGYTLTGIEGVLIFSCAATTDTKQVNVSDEAQIIEASNETKVVYDSSILSNVKISFK